MFTILKPLTMFFPLLLIVILNKGSHALEPITKQTFNASGNHEFVFKVQKWGRFAVDAKSAVGTSIEIHDKKRGLITQAGTSGEKDGRIDLLLDIGDYKVKSSSPLKGKGTVTISVYPFAGADEKQYPELPLQKQVSSQCKDLEQVSWWISIPSDTVAFIEVQGRQLADLALWYNGNWRVDCPNFEFVNKKNADKPLRGLRIIDHLKKGNYLLTAYGGRNSSWTSKDTTCPIYAQFGLSVLGLPAMYQYTIPKTGTIRFGLSSGTRSVVLETASKNNMYLDVYQMNPRSDINRVSSDSIHSKSVSPRTIVYCSGSSPQLATISGVPGDVFTVTTLGSLSSSMSVGEKGSYWLSTLHTGKPEDLIGVSGFIYDYRDGKILAMQADTVSGNKQVRKKFNLLDNVNTYLWIEEDGHYTFETEETVEYHITRFYAINPPESNPTLIHTGIATEALKKGVYNVQIVPKKKGICTFAVKKSLITGGLTASLKNAVGIDNFKAIPPKLFWQIPDITLPNTAVIVINQQSPELGTIVLRKLPMSLPTPLTVFCNPGQQIDLPVNFRKGHILKVYSPAGKTIQMMVDKGAYSGAVVDSGDHTISINSKADGLSQVIITAIPQDFASNELKMVSHSDSIPFAETGKPLFFDMNYSDRADYQFSVPEAGIYRIETAGRLSTGIQIRDRLLQFVVTSQGKGIGRNAIYVDYLLPGQYLISVTPEGSSAGHLSLHIKKDELLNGGKLDKTFEKRSIVPAYKGILYDITTKAKGTYAIKSFGRNTTFAVRLEDSEGWPVVNHGSESPVSATLKKGSYRLISLPAIYEARRIAKLSLTGKNPQVFGKGPHQLRLNESLTSTWVQEKKGDSIPAVFECSIPSAIDASLVVSPEFKAVVYKKGSDKEVVSWSGKKTMRIASGEYAIRVAPLKSRNHITYSLSIKTRDLVPGCHYTIEKPKILRVQVDKKGVYEFFSQGMMDVSAKLLAENAQTVIAENDDGFLDWNFSVSKILDTGRYFLKIISEESSFSSTEVFMKAISDTMMTSPEFDEKGKFTTPLDMKGKVVVYPLLIAKEADIFSVTVDGESRVASVIESKSGNTWVPVGETHGEKFRLSVPVVNGKEYRLKVWSEDHINENIRLSCKTAVSKQVTIDEMVRGDGFHANKDNNLTAYYTIDLAGQGPAHYAIESDNAFLSGVKSTNTSAKAFYEEKGQFVSATSEKLYLEITYDKEGGQRFKLVPIRISDKEPVAVQMYHSGQRTYDLESKKETLTIVSIEMNPGQPLAGIVSNGKNTIWTHNGQPVRNGQFFDDNFCAVACFPDDIQKVTLWNASGSDVSFATITGAHYRIKNLGKLPESSFLWAKGSEEAIMYTFEDTASRSIQLVLPPGTGVIYRSHSDDRQFIQSGNSIRNAVISANGGSLVVYRNNRDIEIKADIYFNKGPQLENLKVESGSSIVKQFSPGKTILQINGAQKGQQRLFWKGSIQNVHWIDSYGVLRNSISDGATINNVSGLLVVESDGGWGKAGICKKDVDYSDYLLCRWESGHKPEKPVDIHSATKVALHDGVNWFKIKIRDTTHINFNVQSALTAILLKESKPVQFQEAWETFNWDIPLPEGTYYLGIKGLAGKSLNGIDFTVAFKQMPLLSEKSPFKTFIGPGESKIARISINGKRMYGIGISMRNETVESRIMNSKYEVLNTGKQHYISLDPGVYYIWFRVPPTLEGTEITTYLFGQEAPPNEPPEYLVRWIINGADGERPTADQNTQYYAPQIKWDDYGYNSSYNDNSSDNYNSENYNNESENSEGSQDQYNEESGGDEQYDESSDSGEYNESGEEESSGEESSSEGE